MSRFEIAGKTALITGAGSGIGRATAHALARRGATLILIDVSEARLQTVAHELIAAGRQAQTIVCDLADPEQIKAAAAEVAQGRDHLDILMNNAGVAIGGSFEEVVEEDFDWLLSINLFGVVRMTRAFLPMLKAAGQAQIVNVSSIFGVIAPPGQTAYSASKFAVRGFSNALLAELEGTGVGVTVIHPGGVATRIAEDAKMPVGASNAEVAERLDAARKALIMDPEKAGEAIAKAIETRRRRLILGNDAQVVAFLERLFPVTHMQWIRRLRGGSKL